MDSALLLAVLLRQEGAMRVTDAADRIGVSVSTAHRLLGMLVYRDFAVQLPDRRYDAGPLLRGAGPRAPVPRLREAALPWLRELTTRWGETTNLLVLSGVEIRFVASLECDRALRVGDRTGRVLPAHAVSGGRALLAAMPAAELEPFLDHGDLDDRGRRRTLRALQHARRHGYAVNAEATESGLTAIGVALPSSVTGAPPAAISLAMPSVRWSGERAAAWGADLRAAAERIGAELDG